MSDDPTPRQREPMSPLAVVVAAIGVLLMLFSGGCTANLIYRDPSVMNVALSLFVGGFPFGFGFFLWWLAVKRSRSM